MWYPESMMGGLLGGGDLRMAFVNVAVYTGGRLVPTKKALREAVTRNPEDVEMEGTSPFAPFFGTLADADKGVTYQAVGPDPWSKRSWYASIKYASGGLNEGWRVT